MRDPLSQLVRIVGLAALGCLPIERGDCQCAQEIRDGVRPKDKRASARPRELFWPARIEGELRLHPPTGFRNPGGFVRQGLGPYAEDWVTFLDSNGIEKTVLYPTQGLTLGVYQDVDFAAFHAG